MRLSSRRAEEGGSVLILVPVGFLVLILLAAIAVDGAVSYLGQRQLVDAVSGAANDAATAGLDSAAFYRSGVVQIDPARAGAAVCQAVTAQGDADLRGLTIWIAVAGPVIRVRARAEVAAVFGRIVPGFGLRVVTGEASAAAAGAVVDRTEPQDFVLLNCALDTAVVD